MKNSLQIFWSLVMSAAQCAKFAANRFERKRSAAGRRGSGVAVRCDSAWPPSSFFTSVFSAKLGGLGVFAERSLDVYHRDAERRETSQRKIKSVPVCLTLLLVSLIFFAA